MTLRETKTISTSWAVVLLAILPSRLISHAVDHAVRSQPGTLTQDKEADLRRHFGGQFKESVTLIRSSLRNAFLVVTVAILAALVWAFVLHSAGVAKTQTVNAWLQYGGIGILLWATLGRAESGIETFDGSTLPERVNLWVYRVLYILGSFALTLSVAW